jgi:hypothetical protein
MKMYAVLFTRNDFSGITRVITIKKNLNDAVNAATDEVKNIIETTGDKFTIEEGIENGNIEYAESEELFDEDLLFSWYFTKHTMEVLIQEIEVE